MKKKFLLLMAATLGVVGLAHAEQYLVKGIDLTGQTQVTASQLGQLVDSATLASGKGMIIASNAAPDTATTSALTNSLWLDVTTVPPSLKLYSTGSWVTATIGAGAVDTLNLADYAVTAVKLATNAVFEYHVNDNAITRAKIAALAVNADKIENAAVNRDKLAANAVDSTILTNNAVNTSNIVDLAVTTAKLAEGSITQAKLAANSVAQTNLLINSVNRTNIMADAVAATNIVDATITTNKLAFALAYQSVTAEQGFQGGTAVQTFAHGFASKPTMFQIVLRCTSSDLGWAVGDEVDIKNVHASGGSPLITVGVDASNFLIASDVTKDNWVIQNKGGTGDSAINTNAWAIVGKSILVTQGTP